MMKTESKQVRRKAWDAKYAAKRVPQRVRAAHARYRLNRYELSQEAFASILTQQEWRCAICSIELVDGHFVRVGDAVILKPDDSPVRAGWHRDRACVDHDHETGRVRGVLCTICNRAIGLPQESAELVERAAKYLRTDVDHRDPDTKNGYRDVLSKRAADRKTKRRKKSRKDP